MRAPSPSILPILVLASVVAHGSPHAATVSGSVYAPNVPMEGAVVYIVPEANQTYAPPTESPVIDQVNLRFVPHVRVVLPGTTVEFRNSDPILHNVFNPGNTGEGFNLGTYPRPDSRTRTFNVLGAHMILCHVHPEMAAYVVVVPTPYHSIVDATGRFRIDNVPPGRHTLHVWHRRTKPFERTVVVPDGSHLDLELELSRRR